MSKSFGLFVFLLLVIGFSAPVVLAETPTSECNVEKHLVLKGFVAFLTHKSDISSENVKTLIHAYLGSIDCSVTEEYDKVEDAIDEAEDISDNVLPTCEDGTIYSSCSDDRPKYCYNGRLVDRCDFCCSTGVCDSNGLCSSGCHNHSIPDWYVDDKSLESKEHILVVVEKGCVSSFGTEYLMEYHECDVYDGERLWVYVRDDNLGSLDVGKPYVVVTDSSSLSYIVLTSAEGTALPECSDLIDCESYGVGYWCSDYDGWKAQCMGEGEYIDLDGGMCSEYNLYGTHCVTCTNPV